MRKATDKLQDRAAFQTSAEKDLEVLVDSLNVSQLGSAAALWHSCPVCDWLHIVMWVLRQVEDMSHEKNWEKLCYSELLRGAEGGSFCSL